MTKTLVFLRDLQGENSMSGTGSKLIDGLRDAVAGNFSQVTIEGQTWVRADHVAELECAVAEHFESEYLIFIIGKIREATGTMSAMLSELPEAIAAKVSNPTAKAGGL